MKTPNLTTADIQKAFNLDFCQRLEYHLSRALHNSKDNDIKWLWCDGVDVPDASSQYFDPPDKIHTKAWFGLTGQDRFNMIIVMGNQSLKNCSQELNLNDCLPDDQTLDWVYIDLENKLVELKLG